VTDQSNSETWARGLSDKRLSTGLRNLAPHLHEDYRAGEPLAILNEAARRIEASADNPASVNLHDDAAELARLEAEFEEAGGRGVELAERIDTLRSRLGPDDEASVDLPEAEAGGWDGPFASPAALADWFDTANNASVKSPDRSIRGQAIAYAREHELRLPMEPELLDTAPLLAAVEQHRQHVLADRVHVVIDEDGRTVTAPDGPAPSFRGDGPQHVTELAAAIAAQADAIASGRLNGPVHAAVLRLAGNIDTLKVWTS
jgi:hypothetical protein